MSMETLRDKAAIVGIGSTTFSTDTSRPGVALALEAIDAAIADAGLAPADIDGVVKYSVDSSASVEMLAANLGVDDFAYWAEVPHGGGASCAVIQLAATAVATGVA